MTDSRVKKPRWEKLHTGCLQGFKFATAFTYGTSPCSTSYQVIELHLQREGLTLAFGTFECSLTGLGVGGMYVGGCRTDVGVQVGMWVGSRQGRLHLLTVTVTVCHCPPPTMDAM